MYTFYISYKLIAEKELMVLAEHLRSWTEKAMKIEVAPWIREYVVDMAELYTELTLERAEYMLHGEQCKVLESYIEAFEISEPEEVHFNIISEYFEIKSGKRSTKKNNTGRQNAFKSLLSCTGKYSYKEEEETEKVEEVKKGKKILFKGEPGMGKTIVGKKIGWDWAKGIMQNFQIVFFVFLKLVKPGDSIENVIIKQTPVLKGLGITEHKLLNFLEILGNRCLLILDGFDECALGQNHAVIEIVRGEKLFKCNILLTSRPHSTREITGQFQTVVKVTGFTEDQARKFAFKILNDEELVGDVLSFTPPTLTEDDTKLYQCPILLSFLCLLVKEKEISLSDKAISLGEIYTRMVRCLYRKFTIRKNRSFDTKKFVDTMKRIGKIAFRALLSGNPLLKRSEVVKEVDEEVFDYGLLIGHEDAYRLLRDETADIFITFPHLSIMEFLGALYFVLMLSSNTTIESLFDGHQTKPIFMTDPLLLDFCLWFLCEKNSYIPIDGKEVILTTLAEFYAETFVSSCFHTEHITQLCPVLDLRRAERKNDELMFAFYRKFLEKFQNVNTVVLDFRYPHEWILEAMIQNYENIRHINIKGVFSYFACTRNCTIKVSMERQGKLPECLVHLIAKQYLKFDKPARVHFFQREDGHDLATNSICRLGRFITHLCVVRCSVSDVQLKLLADTVTQGKMSRLSHLSFISCKFVALYPFFEMKAPHLSHLNFDNCSIGNANCESLAEAVRYKFTNLTSLTVVNEGVDHFLDTVLSHGLLGMTQFFPGFYLRNYAASMTHFIEAVNDQKMPNLSSLRSVGFKHVTCIPVIDLLRTLPLQSLALSNFYVTKDELMQMISLVNLRELNLSDCSNVGGNLSPLLDVPLSSLHTLTLRKCNLGSHDLRFLAQATAMGKLPKLKCLDISLNRGYLEDVFANCLWNELLSLNILHEFLDLGRELSPLCFRALQHLSASDRTLQVLLSRRIVWPCLRSLHVYMLNEKTMSHIVNAQRQHLLPVLESLCVHLSAVGRSVFDLDATYRLRNVSVHDAESFRNREEIYSWGCVCYDKKRY